MGYISVWLPSCRAGTNISVDNSTPMAKSVDAVSKPLLLPGAFGVQPMTFTEIENNECNIIKIIFPIVG